MAVHGFEQALPHQRRAVCSESPVIRRGWRAPTYYILCSDDYFTSHAACGWGANTCNRSCDALGLPGISVRFVRKRV